MKRTGNTQSCLPEKCDLMCSLANNTLMNVTQSIADGDVTVQEMESINTKERQMENLCAIIQECFSINKIVPLLKRRITEYGSFKMYQNGLSLFCDEISGLTVEG